MNQEKFMKKVVGHDRLKELFRRLIDKDKLPHALLFYGPEGVGKEAAGLELGKYMLCQADDSPGDAYGACRKYSRFEHPDFFFLFPIAKPKKDYTRGEWEAAMNDAELKLYREEIESKIKDIYYRMNYPRASDILIGQVRQVIRKSSLTAHQAGNRFVLISPADRMNKEAQNSLLKLLEEPPEGFYLCLITSRPESLLTTVVSRCQPFYFPPLGTTEILSGLMEFHHAPQDKAQMAAEMADGSFAKALDIFKSGNPLRTVAVDEFLSKVVKNNPIEIYKMVKKLAPKNVDKKMTKEILLNVEHWLKDIEMMDNGLNPHYNLDLRDRLQRFRENVIYRDITKMRELLASSVDLIDKNVYIDMMYINLANQFSRVMRWKR